MIIVLGALAVFVGLLWWVLSLLMPDEPALASTVMIGGVVIAVSAFVYLRSERFIRSEERDYSRRFRSVFKEAQRAGRYDEMWEVTRRETADEDMALFIAAEEQGRLNDSIAEWDQALQHGREEEFFRERRQD